MLASCISEQGEYEEYMKNSKILNSRIPRQSNLEIGTRAKYTFLQRRCRCSQKVCERMLSIPGHQGNANQKLNELWLHPGKMGLLQKDKR